MLHSIWEFSINALSAFFLPLICAYYACTTNVFLNVSYDQASGLEKLGNELLMPCHYLFVGQNARQEENGEWHFTDRFDYSQNFLPKTLCASAVAIPSFIAGVSVKALSLIGKQSRTHHVLLQNAIKATHVKSQQSLYFSAGIHLGVDEETEWFLPQGHERRPGDEKNLQFDKEALQEIGRLFNESKIPWWIDCGSCLGAYRYGGVIPWDEDIDIAVLVPDFDNIKRVLNKLDPTKYIVQDWSSREHPKSYIKVFVRASQNLIDIYHYKIDPEKREVSYLFALEHSWVFPEWWKNRELKFTVPASYDIVFPLKKALFDGIEVFVPHDPERYLQRYYGENLEPVKIFNPITNQYERDLSHPYWQRGYMH